MNYNDPIINKLKDIYPKAIYLKMSKLFLIVHDNKEYRINQNIVETLDKLNKLDKLHLMDKNIQTNKNVKTIMDME